jgi:hypothetical protein
VTGSFGKAMCWDLIGKYLECSELYLKSAGSLRYFCENLKASGKVTDLL